MKTEDWGLIEYEEALGRQLAAVEKVAETSQEILVFCSHPPVVTKGRSTQDGDISTWSGPILEVQRGGRATYHGPSQIVVYPIIDLKRRGRDLHRYLRALESAIAECLLHFKIDARVETGATGVWVGARKIASIGVAVKHWVTYHGLAVNVFHDPEAFKGLRPCGFTSETMVSIEELIGAKPEIETVKVELDRALRRHLLRLVRSEKEPILERDSLAEVNDPELSL